ncbi:MAG TPA: TetR/AcrR family transcriptional regulator [Pseudonocardia sp.]|jgi:AcrR family transcriptional regulator|nr:TetR/AcrR family transcriptional regulator [Pseudonocardia sp.]
MTRAASRARAERISRRQVDKFSERRRELADAAILTLSELGYARTSLREIAQNSGCSLGVLHYYFADKVDLITCCVGRYKAHCVLRYDRIVAEARTPEGLADGLAEGLAATLRDEATLHRLWYDLRSQAQFEQTFRGDVLEIDASLERMIWRIVTRYSELVGLPPRSTPSTAYAMFDGVFQQALLRHIAGQETALDELRAGAHQLLRLLVG